MASSPRSRSRASANRRSGGRPPAGGGRGGGGRGGYAQPKKSSAAPILATVIVLGAVIGLVVMTSGKKNKAKPAEPSPTAVQRPGRTPDAPPKPQRLPPPELTAAQRAAGDGLVDEIEEIGEEGDRLYQEAGEAKAAGDDDLWQQRLTEAAQTYNGIKDLWNELVAQMPNNADWDEEQVANHYFTRQVQAYEKAMKRVGEIAKDRR